MSILVIIEENIDFSRNFKKTLILVNKIENLDFGKNFRKFLFWWIFMKISIMVNFFQHLR